jgi:putative inorganic carbon (HCO3(-)) transporter
MNLTAAVWAALACALLLAALARPVWGFGLYLLTFFAAPQLWWWGDALPSARYALWAGIALLVSVLWHQSRRPGDAPERRMTLVHAAAIGMVLNATLVHLIFASAPAISFPELVELFKFVLLFFLLWSAIQNRDDLRVALVVIAVGAAYIGYEVTINGRGSFKGSRLEGVGTPGADTSNGLACLMLTVLPLIGSLFVNGRKREWVFGLLAAPLVLNVLILCNSRGAFLGLIGAGLCFLALARGVTRKHAVRTLLLGSVLLYALLGDPEIFQRFMTTFVGSEERDTSASSRITFWKAGMLMVADYPLGAGGRSFKFVHGRKYIADVAGTEGVDRSLHNGYLTEATDWGVQGLILKLLFFGGAIAAARRTCTRCRLRGDVQGDLLGLCVIAAVTGLLINSVFGSFLGNEWGYWAVALLVRYADLYREDASADGTTVSTAERQVAA